MKNINFKNSKILEKINQLNRMEEFLDAIESNNIEGAAFLMKIAGVEEKHITQVLRKMANPSDKLK